MMTHISTTTTTAAGAAGAGGAGGAEYTTTTLAGGLRFQIELMLPPS